MFLVSLSLLDLPGRKKQKHRIPTLPFASISSAAKTLPPQRGHPSPALALGGLYGASSFLFLEKTNPEAQVQHPAQRGQGATRSSGIFWLPLLNYDSVSFKYLFFLSSLLVCCDYLFFFFCLKWDVFFSMDDYYLSFTLFLFFIFSLYMLSDSKSLFYLRVLLFSPSRLCFFFFS